mgnify:CR=1 FL=1
MYNAFLQSERGGFEMRPEFCIVCKGELTLEDPGRIIGDIYGYASESPIEYIPPNRIVYHDRCKQEGLRIQHEQNKERYRKMGVLRE